MRFKDYAKIVEFIGQISQHICGWAPPYSQPNNILENEMNALLISLAFPLPCITVNANQIKHRVGLGMRLKMSRLEL